MYSARRVESMTTFLIRIYMNIISWRYVSQTLGIQLWNFWANDGWCEACNVNIRSPESRTRKSTAIQYHTVLHILHWITSHNCSLVETFKHAIGAKRPVGEGKPQLRKNMLRRAGSAWMLRQGTQSLTHLALLSHFVSLCVLVQLSMCKCFTFRVLTNV